MTETGKIFGELVASGDKNEISPECDPGGNPVGLTNILTGSGVCPLPGATDNQGWLELVEKLIEKPEASETRTS